MLFDGKAFAAVIEERLKKEVALMERKPKLVILSVSNNEASKRYVEMKKALGERIGVIVEDIKVGKDELKEIVEKMGMDSSVNGLMVQLPIEGMDKNQTEEILSLIPLEKDVDGLNPENLELLESGEQTFIPATVKAVERILDEAYRQTELDIDESLNIGVVGAAGSVGRALAVRLKRYGISVVEIDLGDDLEKLVDCSVVISCTGSAGLIKASMVKEGVIIVDVGFPVGDVDVEVAEKAAFFTPVPGGVGPVTVVSLMENLIVGPTQR